jgi:hypothetical protein
MANQLTMALIDSILTLHQRNWSNRRIARELGIDRQTVADYLRAHGGEAKPANAPIGSGDADSQAKPANAPIGSEAAAQARDAQASMPKISSHPCDDQGAHCRPLDPC